jgi:aspartate/methionine/tyrosine aminotransferase
MVNSPNNPTGRVLSRAEIDAIVYVAQQHDLYVISDEIYEHIVFTATTYITAWPPSRAWPNARSSSTASARRMP